MDVPMWALIYMMDYAMTMAEYGYNHLLFIFRTTTIFPYPHKKYNNESFSSLSCACSASMVHYIFFLKAMYLIYINIAMSITSPSLPPPMPPSEWHNFCYLLGTTKSFSIIIHHNPFLIFTETTTVV